MGNQGTALDSSREAIAQLRSGVLGTLKEVYAWSNRPVWNQGPGRRMTMEKFAAQAMKEDPAEAPAIIEAKKKEIAKTLERVDWKSWIGVAPDREFWPGLYHDFQFRGWWDFGTGALGDMACHQLTVPFASCGLRDPISVSPRLVAMTSIASQLARSSSSSSLRLQNVRPFRSTGTIVWATSHQPKSSRSGASRTFPTAVCSSLARKVRSTAPTITAASMN